VRKQCLQVSQIPDDEFEDMVEAARPPTLDELAERGRNHKAPSEEELNAQHLKQARKELANWYRRWNFLPQVEKLEGQHGRLVAKLDE
jgi:hypothetical protein